MMMMMMMMMIKIVLNYWIISIDQFRNCTIILRQMHCWQKELYVNKMPVSCCAVGCTSCFRKGAGVGFYVFPVDQRRREMWIQAISHVGTSGQKWELSAHDRVCELHYVSGRPLRSNNDVDYVPTVFTAAKKRSNVTERDTAREEWALKRLKTKESYVEVEEAATILVELSQSAERSNCDVTAVDRAVQTSDGIWEENVSLREEVVTVRAAVDEAKDQLLEGKITSSGVFVAMVPKQSFTLACLGLQYVWHSLPSLNQRWERLVCGVEFWKRYYKGRI